MELAAEVVRLSELAPRADRCFPVDERLADLFPEGGLLPGQVTGFAGSASYSLALCAVSRAVTVGSWLAIVGVPDLGVEAAIAAGVPAARLVAVDAGSSPLDWSERVAACADGFGLIIARAPRRADRMVRRLRQRLAARGSVLLLLDPPAATCDTELTTADSRWIGIGPGHGALLARSVRVTVSGRRRPRPISTQVWLPDAHRYRLVC